MNHLVHVALIFLAALWMVSGVIAADHRPQYPTRREIWHAWRRAK